MQLAALSVGQDAFDLLVERLHVCPARLRIGAFVLAVRALQDARNLLFLRIGEIESTHRTHVGIAMMAVVRRGGGCGGCGYCGTRGGNGLGGSGERQCERRDQCKRSKMMSKHGETPQR